jgi:O-antigen ligase
MLPALAVLLGILRWGAFRAYWVAWSIVGTVILAVGLGALQISGGRDFYIYEITNPGKGVGFFANANHQGTLLLVGIAFIAGLFASSQRTPDTRQKGGTRHSTALLLAGAGLVVIATGLLINRSLAGWGLSLPVAGAALLLVQNAPPKARRIGTWILSLATIGAAALIFLDPLGTTIQSEEKRGSTQSRYVSISQTLEAGVDYLPLGTGVGTFPDIYRGRENPDTVTRVWMNHAHSDYAEVFLEVGIPGVLLLLAFLVWWVRNAIKAWADEEGDPFARAASIASAAILVHSLVDYPLRTAAISAIFAGCCALMISPRERGDKKKDSDSADRPRHLSA